MFTPKKLFLGLAGALTAITVTTLALPGSPVMARESSQAATTCTGQFSASASDARENSSISGRATMEVAGTSFRGTLEVGNGQSARLYGETAGIGVFVAIEMPDGLVIMGMGGGVNPLATCRGRLGGLFNVLSDNPLLNDMTGTWELVMGS